MPGWRDLDSEVLREVEEVEEVERAGGQVVAPHLTLAFPRQSTLSWVEQVTLIVLIIIILKIILSIALGLTLIKFRLYDSLTYICHHFPCSCVI